MPESIKIWENSADTPLSASNLSKLIDFQSESKFIHLTTDPSDYESWADITISGSFPDDIPSEWSGLNVLNTDNNVIKKASLDTNTQTLRWRPSRDSMDWSLNRKVLKISANVQISMSYVDSNTKQRVYTSFDLGDKPQLLSFDDYMNESFSQSDFDTDSTYQIFLFHNFSYGDKAMIKIIDYDDLTKDFWKKISSNPLSPTGNEVIAYRKIGGFKTDDNAEIVEESIWDLYTYRSEVSTSKINIYENGFVREMNSSDIDIVDEERLFNANDVEGALNESRFLLNNMQNQFYTNKRVGVSLRFTPFKKNVSVYQETEVNEITLFLSAGTIDVFGTKKTLGEHVFLNDPNLPMRINDGPAITGITLGDGVNRLGEGIWRVYLDPSNTIDNGNIIFKHEDFEMPRYRPELFGWFDNFGNRCIGKFKVRTDNGFYIEKMSVTDTFDVPAPPNSIHVHHGTLVPDGLLLCDGRWHDIYGYDNGSYTWIQLMNKYPNLSWGSSWFEETPNMMGKFFRMSPESVLFGSGTGYLNVSTGQNFILPTSPTDDTRGGSTDCGLEGGTEYHSHSFPHEHGTGNMNIISSGEHPQQHTITFSGNTESVTANIDGPEGGSYVDLSTKEHNHNMIIGGGRHNHATDSFQGKTERLEDEDAETQQSQNLPPYKDFLICIKK